MLVQTAPVETVLTDKHVVYNNCCVFAPSCMLDRSYMNPVEQRICVSAYFWCREFGLPELPQACSSSRLQEASM